MSRHLWLISAMVAFATLWHAMPRMTRPTVFFAVRVPEGFAATVQAHQILAVYRAIVWASFAAGVAMLAAGASANLALLSQVFVASAAWTWAHRRTRPHAGPVPSVRAASLEVRTPTLPGGPVVALGPFIILIVVAAYLHFNWELLPDRIPTRWALDGTPQTWRARSVGAVYRNLVLAAVVAAMMLATARGILRRTRQLAIDGASGAAERRFKTVHASYAIVSAYLLVVIASIGSLQALMPSRAAILFPLGVILILAAVMVVWSLKVGPGGQRELWRQGLPDPGDNTPDSAWRLGHFYFNRNDSALFVERRMGLGWTLNFGHWMAWAFIAVLVALWAALRLAR